MLLHTELQIRSPLLMTTLNGDLPDLTNDRNLSHQVSVHDVGILTLVSRYFVVGICSTWGFKDVSQPACCVSYLFGSLIKDIY